MGRPRTTLLARVLKNRFRPGRYGELLAGEPLPRQPPFRDQRRRELWHELIRVQESYREQPNDFDAHYFSRLVRALHGAPTPLHYRRGGVAYDALLDRALARVGSDDDAR